jgi:acyl transferase domain-containing protein
LQACVLQKFLVIAKNRLHFLILSCRVYRFAGDLHGLEEVHTALRDTTELHAAAPFSRWDLETLYNPRGGVGKVSARIGTYVHSTFVFDQDAFGLSPNEAALMDPQQRILLEETAAAFHASEHALSALSGSSVGVYVGCIWLEYGELLATAGVPAGAYMVTGNGLAFMSGRVSYTFGFVGPCVPTNTACSSSLVATHLAAHGITHGDCAVATASGVNALLVPAAATAAMTQVSALSLDGRCKAFGAEADGYGRGEGYVAIVLEPVAALKTIAPLAMLAGSAVNQDGRSSGLTAPHGPSQQALIVSAMRQSSISYLPYVASHGTGTPLGDPIETGALRKAVAPANGEMDAFTVGAMKTLTGHLEGAAGLAGVVLSQVQLKQQFSHGLRYRWVDLTICRAAMWCFSLVNRSQSAIYVNKFLIVFLFAGISTRMLPIPLPTGQCRTASQSNRPRAPVFTLARHPLV